MANVVNAPLNAQIYYNGDLKMYGVSVTNPTITIYAIKLGARIQDTPMTIPIPLESIPMNSILLLKTIVETYTISGWIDKTSTNVITSTSPVINRGTITNALEPMFDLMEFVRQQGSTEPVLFNLIYGKTNASARAIDAIKNGILLTGTITDLTFDQGPQAGALSGAPSIMYVTLTFVVGELL